jgi:hypothetical protein
VIARQSVWSDTQVAKLLADFIPCADEVWRLQNRNDPDCVHFRKFCDEGGMLNDRDATTTRQGTYCCTPSGMFLGSMNHRDPVRVAGLLRDALKKWKEIKKEDRLLKDDPAEAWKQVNRAEKQYPEDGLVLRVNSRDMPREKQATDWRGKAWNHDYAWFRKEEVARMLPRQFAKKTEWKLPDDLVQRLCRLHLVDNVRGQTNGYAPKSVQEAEINCKVTRIKKGVVTIRLAGKVKMSQEGRGLEATMLGEAKYSTKEEKFEQFELVAAGERWGRTRYNARDDDEGRAGIGYALHIAGDSPTEKVAPAEFGNYGWR